MAFFRRTKKSDDKVKDLKIKAPAVVEDKKPARKKEITSELKKGEEKTTETTVTKPTQLISKELDLSGILLRPRITEKATIAAEQGVYVFEVSPRATKHSVKRAVKKIYKVNPVRVNIVKIPSKKRVSERTRIVGVKSGGKKAYVFLKKGERIEFV